LAELLGKISKSSLAEGMLPQNSTVPPGNNHVVFGRSKEAVENEGSKSYREKAVSLIEGDDVDIEAIAWELKQW
jgi:hypothetical protein